MLDRMINKTVFSFFPKKPERSESGEIEHWKGVCQQIGKLLAYIHEINHEIVENKNDDKIKSAMLARDQLKLIQSQVTQIIADFYDDNESLSLDKRQELNKISKRLKAWLADLKTYINPNDILGSKMLVVLKELQDTI
jgi:hypothetical protein